MGDLGITDPELSALADETLGLAKSYWSGLEARPTYPASSAEETERLFARP